MNNLVLKEMDVMQVEPQMAGRAGGRRPRIVRQRGAAGLLEAVHSQLYRLLVLVLPLR
ncbi:MAG TPA: hypothetical protein VH257_12170 [Chloroflexota bacterium]|jgi:hypothetical protein|nr:hypothetical protein [Chloroflexota bacterium]HEX2515454.1 hypothetical protein [Chloroflexota bacterium]